MKLVDLDYYALYGKSWLNKLPTGYKLVGVFAVLTLVVILQNYLYMSLVYSVLFGIILFSKLPKLKIFSFSLYPLIFLIFYFFSINNLSLDYALLLVFKVLSSATAFVLLVFTTTYFEIFKKLDRILPSFLVSILFITYRSIFILWGTLENLQLAIRMRGKLKITRPLYTLKTLSNSLGYLIIRAIEASENMYEAMRIRGYSSDLKFLRK